jgi:phosphoribosylformylglycinamidine synthase subunit PurSL
MIYRVEVTPQAGQQDSRGENIRRQAESLGIAGIERVAVSDLYFLDCADDTGESSANAAASITQALLCDPVIEDATVVALAGCATQSALPFIEVSLRPGVTDSVAESLLSAARTLGITALQAAATGQRYTFSSDPSTGPLSSSTLAQIAAGLLANEVIQTYTLSRLVDPPFVPVQPVDATVETIPLAAAADEVLQAISSERRLALDLAEMRAIRDYYQAENREPTDIELEMLAQTWSEHCGHKSFKALVAYEERDASGALIPGSQREIDSLLKTFIQAATETVNRPWVYSAFVDNAGIIAFDDRFDLAFKVETHNHPSALEPFGGANTGVGGVVRDVIGVSARPIANTDILCFGPPDQPLAELPAGVQHPRRTADGVIAGVEDYGNKMGIPTVNGAILYDQGYTANPLVFCGCLGILPHGSHRSTPAPGDLVVVLGGRTGRDGLRGATFSSMEMNHETGQVAGSAVQIGHPIHEKQTLEAIIIARDAGLYSAITDCGAGGLSSAVGEMAEKLGAEIHLERVPLKYPGLRPWEIWLSEAQERMVLAVSPTDWPKLAQICAGLDVEATVLGHFTGDGCVTLFYAGQVVGKLSTAFLHNGIPRRRLTAVWTPPTGNGAPSVKPAPQEMRRLLLALLAQPDTRSKEDVVRRYDHEVQGGTVVKPFVGAADSGPSDAAVLALTFRLDSFGGNAASTGAAQADQPEANGRGRNAGVALASGINPHYGILDPYAMAWAAVDEAVRNCVAVGADPDRLALLDNFCWGNPSLPDRLGSLVRCSAGCHDAAVAYAAPFVSGKDSLNNEYTGADGHKQAILGTLLISALALVPDVTRTVTSDLKQPGNWLYLTGLTQDELGGSAYHRLSHNTGGRAPQPVANAPALYRAVHQAIGTGLVRACHDCSEGGLAVAAAEMALGGHLGLDLDLRSAPHVPDAVRTDTLAFAESLGRLLLEVTPADAAPFEAALAGFPVARVGQVRNDDHLVILGLDGAPAIEVTLADCDHAWRGHLA